MHKPLLAITLGVLLTVPAAADNWPQWRGPAANGVAAGTDYPLRWSETENVAWKAALPGPGASTPAVWQDYIFVTCAGNDGENLALCFDRRGNKRWETPLGRERTGRNPKATGSNPSPTTDGERVYVYYKSGDLACLDFDGRVVWRKNLQKMYGEDELWWDLGTSPVLTKEHLVVACMHGGPSYLVAFDKRTGRVVWRTDRNMDAPLESNDSYTTPVVVDQDETEIIVTLGADHVTAHDAQSGEELWRVGGLNPSGEEHYRSISSPVVSGNLVIAPYARGESLTAVRLGGHGDVTASHVAWSRDSRAAADVATPVAVDGKLYVCRDGRSSGPVLCFDAQSGATLWTARVERTRDDFKSSPVYADGFLYVTREDATTFVLDTANEGEVVAVNRLAPELTVATLVFVDGQILLRTRESLYCIGKK